MNLKENKIYKYKSFLRLALILVLILLMGILFLNTWLVNYNQLLRFKYLFKGNVFITITYMILFYIFMIIYDCNSIPENNIVNMIFSNTLAAISCNVMAYLLIIIPAVALGFLPVLPIVFLIIKEFIIIAAWSFIISIIFNKYFPPQSMLLISNSYNIEKELFKFSKQKYIYNIADTIICNNNLEEIYNKCSRYENIIIGDVTAEDRNDIIKFCFDGHHNIYVIPKISDILIKYSDDFFTLDTPVYLSRTFGLTIENQILKRIFDIVISLFVIIVFMPAWIIISILIKIEDGGPVFFKQERATINNNIFEIIKFRSMKVNSDRNLVLPTAENDSRITKIGNFIRRFHIDEMPQFINVLLGDMSVVGPRPERIEHVELYTKEIKEFEYRSKVKAGITGLAQIYGKYNTSAMDKLKLDLIYIKKYSFMLDIELLFRTFKVIFSKDNTEGFDSQTQQYIKENAK